MKQQETKEKKGTTSKGSKFRRTVHEYPKFFSRLKLDQTSDLITIEINSFIQPSDYKKHFIQSYIADFLIQSNQYDVIEEFGLEAFELNVLGLKRTLTEKLLSLIRASYLENSIFELQERIRHFYDIYILLEQEEIKNFLNSEEFFIYLSNTKEDDKSNQAFYGDWVNNKLNKAPLFENYKGLCQSLEKTYNGIFSTLVYTKLPKSNIIFEAFEKIISRIKSNPNI